MYKRIRKTAYRRPAKRARRFYRRKPLMRKKTRTFNKRVKDVILRTVERKQKGSFTNTVTGVAPETFNWVKLADIAQLAYQSTTQVWTGRTGKEYYITGISMKAMVSNRQLTPDNPIKPMFFRIILLESSSKAAGLVPTAEMAMFQGVDGVNVKYSQVTKTPQSMWYKIDPKWYRTRFDKVYKVGANGGFDTRNIQKYIPLSAKITAQENQVGDNQQSKNFYMISFGFEPQYNDAGGGSCDLDLQWCTYFRDP